MQHVTGSSLSWRALLFLMIATPAYQGPRTLAMLPSCRDPSQERQVTSLGCPRVPRTPLSATDAADSPQRQAGLPCKLRCVPCPRTDALLERAMLHGRECVYGLLARGDQSHPVNETASESAMYHVTKGTLCHQTLLLAPLA